MWKEILCFWLNLKKNWGSKNNFFPVNDTILYDCPQNGSHTSGGKKEHQKQAKCYCDSQAN